MKKHLLLVILLCSFVIESAAGYYAASLTHNQIQGSTYEFNLRVFKDINTDVPTEREMNVGNEIVSLIMTSQSVFENYIEINYAGNYTFPSDGEYITEVTIQNRVGGIQNIPGSVDTPLVIRNKIVVSSDIINNSNFYDFPLIDTVSINQLYTKDLFSIDNDGDSLSFKLLPANDVFGYSFPGEVSEFSLDSVSGTLTWNAPQYYGNYSVLILIEEWRSDTLISYTEFDILIVVDFATDISNENNVLNNEFIVYPNPAKSIINFNLNKTQNKIIHIEIFDFQGKQMFSDSKTNDSSTSIDISNFKKGVYFYRINNIAKEKYDGKFIVK